MAQKITVGIAGLGKMGKNIALQMHGKGYKVIAYNRSETPRKELAAIGIETAATLAELVSKLGNSNRVVWLMLTAGQVTDEATLEVAKLLGKGDIIIDGANSRYTESIRHYDVLKAKGILYLDAGCSGGPSGARNGMCMMIGGDKEAYDKLESMFKELSVKDGYAYFGPPGAGHYVKMVHNAVEYGMMQSIAEGTDLLENGPYKDMDLPKIMRLWQNGSVVRSYLVELAGRALTKNPKLSGIKPYVEDNGEGRWSAEVAIQMGIPLTGITHSLYERFSSRNEKQFSRRVLAALRHEFGGHDVKKDE